MSWFNQSRRTKQGIALLLCLLSIFIVQPTPIQAEGNIEMKVNPGLGGEYKSGLWVPLHVEVTNKGGDLEGDLLVELLDHYNSVGTYYQPISIAQGATRKVTLLVPGSGLNRNTEVKLVSAGQEIAKQKIGGRMLGDDTVFIGILASDADTANFLATLPKNSFPMPSRVTALQAEELPDVAEALQALNILIINNFPADQLSEQQIEAITEWTHNGGLLVLAGGAHYEKLSAAFQGLSPVQVEGTTQIESLDSLANALELNVELQQPLTVSHAVAQSGKVLYQEDNIPLFVADNIGNGTVLYAAYDLAEKPLADWSGNSSLWAELLTRVNGGTFIPGYYSLFEQWWPLSNAVNFIPALNLPNIMNLAITFGVYILFVGPILYFLLRWKGKREWIWFMVPTFACLFAIGIYIYGSMERTGKVLAHNVSLVDLDGQGDADVNGATAIFVPKGGDYSLRLKEHGLVLPNSDYYSSNREQQMKETWVSVNSEQGQITFKNVEFWSMRKASIQTKLEGIGEITSNLHYADGKITGTVTNNTALAFRDVRLVYGRHVQDFEKVDPGESLQVELDFDTAIQPSRNPRGYQLLPAHMQSNDDEYIREQRMVDMLDMNVHHAYQYGTYRGAALPAVAVQSTYTATPLMFLGWTEDQLYDLEVVGHQQEDYNLALVKAGLEIQPAANGYIFYPAGTFEAVLTESNVQVDYDSDGYYLPSGEVTFEFSFNNGEEGLNNFLDIEQIQLYTWSHDRTTFDKFVYNWKTEQYEEYEKVFDNNRLNKENVATYISPEGVLRLKMEHHLDDYRHLGQPAVSVEGKVLQ